MPCRYNRRRVWVTRLMLESYEHKASCFVTLTYSPENLPGDGLVSMRAVQLYLKRLREREAPNRFRYYAVGEYGDVSARPHYHVILFGVDPGQHASRKCVCNICQAWTIKGNMIGHVHVGDLTLRSAQYVAGYVLQGVNRGEKITSRDRLRRGPSGSVIGKTGFSTSSRGQGIAAGAALRIASSLKTAHGKNQTGSRNALSIAEEIQCLRLGGKMLPLGRFLRNRIKESLNGGVKVSEWPTRRLLLQRNRAGLAWELGTKKYIQTREEERVQQSRRSRTTTRIERSRRIL